MELYYKKIKGVNDLKNEIKRLKGDKREPKSKVQESFKATPTKEKTHKSIDQEPEQESINYFALFSSLLDNKGWIVFLANTVLPLALGIVPQKSKVSFLRTVIKELGSSYVYWKLVKWGYYLIKDFVDGDDTKVKKED